MGCDIHVMMEKEVTNGDYTEWKSIDLVTQALQINHCYHGRNYHLFNTLAGVRGDGIHTICDPRGIPDDASDVTRKEWLRWDGNAHTPTYFTLGELIEEHKKTDDVDLGGFIEVLIAHIDRVEYWFDKMKADKYRTVLWFDN